MTHINRTLLKKGTAIIVFAVICVITVLSSNCDRVFAESNDYTLIEGSVEIPIPRTYILEEVINNPGFEYGESRFNSPEDIFINEQGYIFVADTNNNRIVKITKDGELADVVTGPQDKPLFQPKGVFADSDGNMYIADTGNYRIVHLSADGSFVEEFVKPDSVMLPSGFIFDPTKVVLSSTGYIYALKGQSLMTIDAYNNFRGYVGQSKIGFSLRDALIRLFASDEQKKILSKRIAASYTNVFIDDMDMIYAATLDTYEGELKKLNSVGENIYKKYGAPLSEVLSMISKISFDDLAFSYGNRGKAIASFVDISVDSHGIVTAIDSATCSLFQYDHEGNLLTCFGEYGNNNGQFLQPISLDIDDEGKIYVLDKRKNNIQIFRKTVFIENIHEAVIAYDMGDYGQSYDLWEKVLITGENYQLANIGLAKALYKQEKWKDAMQQFRYAGDRVNYSKAYAKYRHSIFRGNFLFVMIGFVLLVTVIVYFAMLLKKRSQKAIEKVEFNKEGSYSLGNTLSLSLGAIFHPLNTFRLFRKLRNNVNIAAGLLILGATVLTRLTYIYVLHYPLVSLAPRDANIWLEILKLILPFLTIVISFYAISAIVGGESKLDEIFLSMSFCMIPYIFVNLPLAALSNIMCRNEEGLFTFIIKVSWIWIIVLFLISIKVLNNYSIKKTIFIAVISIVTMILLWISVLLIMSLIVQLMEFITGLFREIKMSKL